MSIQNGIGNALRLGIKLILGDDAPGDLYFRSSSGVLARLGIGNEGQVLVVRQGLPAWANQTGVNSGDIIVNDEIRINCGGNDYQSSDGKIWEGDKYYSGGDAYDIEYYIGPFTVTGTNDQALYKFERSADPGSFTYSIPISSGNYNLNLHFCENNKTGVGQRVGTVALNGSSILTNFDVFAQTGGQHIALIKSFNNLALSTFALTISNTLINGIELVKIS